MHSPSAIVGRQQFRDDAGIMTDDDSSSFVNAARRTAMDQGGETATSHQNGSRDRQWAADSRLMLA